MGPKSFNYQSFRYHFPISPNTRGRCTCHYGTHMAIAAMPCFAVQIWHRVGGSQALNYGGTATGTIIIATLQSLACSGSLHYIPYLHFQFAPQVSRRSFLQRSSHKLHAAIAQMVNHAGIVDCYHVKCVMPSIMRIAKPKCALPPPVLDATCAIEAMEEGAMVW